MKNIDSPNQKWNSTSRLAEERKIKGGGKYNMGVIITRGKGGIIVNDGRVNKVRLLPLHLVITSHAIFHFHYTLWDSAFHSHNS